MEPGVPSTFQTASKVCATELRWHRLEPVAAHCPQTEVCATWLAPLRMGPLTGGASHTTLAGMVVVRFRGFVVLSVIRCPLFLATDHGPRTKVITPAPASGCGCWIDCVRMLGARLEVGFHPQGFRLAHQRLVVVACLNAPGLEVGLDPQTAHQRLVVVHGLYAPGLDVGLDPEALIDFVDRSL